MMISTNTQKKKIQIAEGFISGCNLNILETHCGFGGMTEFYNNYGGVECYDIVQERIDSVNSMGLEGVTAIKGDSEKEIIRLLYYKCVYDVIDVDPYWMPSRYFPHVFGMMDDGILFVTLPMIGVAQMNKITIRHLSAFWGVDYKDKDSYLDKVISRMDDYAFMHKREIKLLEAKKIGRVFRLAIKVNKKSLCDIVGLKVNRTAN